MFRVPAPRPFARLGATFDALDLDPHDELLGWDADPSSNNDSSTDQFLLEEALQILFTGDGLSPAPVEDAPAVATGETRALEKLRQRRESAGQLTGESRALAMLQKKKEAGEVGAGRSVFEDEDAHTPPPPTGEARALAMLRQRRTSESGTANDEAPIQSQPRHRSSSHFERAASEHKKTRSTSKSPSSSRPLRQASVDEREEEEKTTRRKSGGRSEEELKTVRRPSNGERKRTPTRSTSSGRIKVGDVLTKRDSVTPPRRSSRSDRHPRSSSDHGAHKTTTRRPSHGDSKEEGRRQQVLRVRSVSVPRQPRQSTSLERQSQPLDERRLVTRSKSARLTDCASLHRRSTHGTLIRRRVVKRCESGDGRTNPTSRETRQSPSRSAAETSGHLRASSLYAKDDATTKEVSQFSMSTPNDRSNQRSASSRSIALRDPCIGRSTQTSIHETSIRTSGHQKTNDPCRSPVVVRRARSFDVGDGKPASILRNSIRGERYVHRSKSNTEHERSECLRAISPDTTPIRRSSGRRGTSDSARLSRKQAPLKPETADSHAHSGLLNFVVGSRPCASGDIGDDASTASELSSQSQSKKYTMVSKHSVKSCTSSPDEENEMDWGDESSFASFGSTRSSNSKKCTLVSVSKLVSKSQCRKAQEGSDNQTKERTMFALPSGLHSHHSTTRSVDDEFDSGLRRYSLSDAASLASLRENIRLTNFHRRHSSDGSAQKVEEAVTGALETNFGKHATSNRSSTRIRASSAHIRRTMRDRRNTPAGVCVA